VSEDLCEVCITAPDSDWLAALTRGLVDERLCACGHNITPIRSIYRWKGQLYDETEARVALHTRRALVPEIVRRTKEQHPSKVPGIFVLPITDGSADYLQWIRDETLDV
jgi:periplasmic divalent cation tolerance protein